ncbi:MAG: hypothetical protein ACXADA_24685 [Candidatus Hodarchaeales archaeon]
MVVFDEIAGNQGRYRHPFKVDDFKTLKNSELAEFTKSIDDDIPVDIWFVPKKTEKVSEILYKCDVLDKSSRFKGKFKFTAYFDAKFGISNIRSRNTKRRKVNEIVEDLIQVENIFETRGDIAKFDQIIALLRKNIGNFHTTEFRIKSRRYNLLDLVTGNYKLKDVDRIINHLENAKNPWIKKKDRLILIDHVTFLSKPSNHTIFNDNKMPVDIREVAEKLIGINGKKLVLEVNGINARVIGRDPYLPKLSANATLVIKAKYCHSMAEFLQKKLTYGILDEIDVDTSLQIPITDILRDKIKLQNFLLEKLYVTQGREETWTEIFIKSLFEYKEQLEKKKDKTLPSINLLLKRLTGTDNLDKICLEKFTTAASVGDKKYKIRPDVTGFTDTGYRIDSEFKVLFMEGNEQCYMLSDSHHTLRQFIEILLTVIFARSETRFGGSFGGFVVRKKSTNLKFQFNYCFLDFGNGSNVKEIDVVKAINRFRLISGYGKNNLKDFDELKGILKGVRGELRDLEREKAHLVNPLSRNNGNDIVITTTCCSLMILD